MPAMLEADERAGPFELAPVAREESAPRGDEGPSFDGESPTGSVEAADGGD